MQYIVLIVMSITLFLNGCGGSKPQVVVKEKSLPTWYTNPPLSNSADLYALGEGKSKKEAIAEALSFMASTLSVSISSKYNAQTEVREGRVNSSNAVYKSNITSEVVAIRISSYEVIQAQQLGFKHYGVLVKSNKEKLFNSMVQELEQKFSFIDRQEKVLKNVNEIEKLDFYKKQNESLKNLPNTLIVMNVLNPAFEGDIYIRKTQLIGIAYHDILQSISFSIESNGAAENLKAVIAKGISEKRLKIKKASGAKHFTIYIESKIEKARSYGFWLARSDISIKTKDYKGTVIASNSLQIIGQSSQSFAIAKQNIAFKLAQLIEKNTIASVLALGI